MILRRLTGKPSIHRACLRPFSIPKDTHSGAQGVISDPAAGVQVAVPLFNLSPVNGNSKKSRLTPLCAELKSLISMKGPIPFSDFMEHCLSNPRFGYYSAQPLGTSVIGPHGDFITAPEMCSIYGELIATFYINAWMQMGKPRRVILCEIGCGTGSLMSDVLRAISTISPELWTALEVHVVEISSAFRASLAKRLNWSSPSMPTDCADEKKWSEPKLAGSCPGMGRRAHILPQLPITFHSELDQVPDHGLSLSASCHTQSYGCCSTRIFCRSRTIRRTSSHEIQAGQGSRS